MSNFDVFDIIGPQMIGPSSSHTAGAARIGFLAGQLCEHKPTEVQFFFHGSLSTTYKFHKTDTALLAGLMGYREDSPEIAEAFEIADERGIMHQSQPIYLEDAHPSSMLIKMLDNQHNIFEVQAATIGGGNIQLTRINNTEVSYSGKNSLFIIRGELDIFQTIIKEAEAFNLQKEDGGVVGETQLDKATFISRCAEMLRKNEFLFIEKLNETSDNKLQFFSSVKDLMEFSENEKKSLSEIVIEHEMKKSNRSKEEVMAEMTSHYETMISSVNQGLKPRKLLAGMFPDTPIKMDILLKNSKSLISNDFTEIIRNALAVMTVNGSMGKIVACPTAGSAGTVPAALITIANKHNISKEKIVRSMFTGAGLGMIIADNSTLSGSVGGCQAETGVAASIAAAILTDLFGGDNKQIENASSLAIGNVMGLVCDPIAGAVEIPCIQRNALGAMNAIVSAEMALAGIDAVVPLDEMISAMLEVSQMMNPALKDTLGGGISNTLTGKKIEKELLGESNE